MGCHVKEKCCPVLGQLKATVQDMVIDRPWLWTLGAFFVGLLFGRKRCCRKKS